MDCLNPIEAWCIGHAPAKDGIVSPRLCFSQSEALKYFSHHCASSSHVNISIETNRLSLPCGKCVNCLVRKRKDMTVRLSHELSMYDKSCFITLTYDDDHIWSSDASNDNPLRSFFRCGTTDTNTLYPPDLTKFLKDLRRGIEYHYHLQGVRFFAVGEYGSRTSRPHFHLIIFGWRPDDLKVHHLYKGRPLFISDFIASRWKNGFHTVQDVSTSVAKYCARYVTKKLTRTIPLPDTVVPEFTRQSVGNGGMGSTFCDKFAPYFMRSGFCTVRSGDKVFKASIPSYYIARCRKLYPDLFLFNRDMRTNSVCKTITFDQRLRKAARFEYDNMMASKDDFF